MITISARSLRACVAAAGTSPAAADARCGLPAGTVQALLAGEPSEVGSDVLLKLVIGLDCTPEQISGSPTEQARAFHEAKNTLALADALAVLGAVYEALDEAGQAELRRAVTAVRQVAGISPAGPNLEARRPGLTG